ncbi:MAG: protein kinase domain-containing protein, partial [Anaerolineae bacterium]
RSWRVGLLIQLRTNRRRLECRLGIAALEYPDSLAPARLPASAANGGPMTDRDDESPQQGSADEGSASSENAGAPEPAPAENPLDLEATVSGVGATPPPHAPSQAMPAAIGEYRIVGLLGQGGMGVVWEAEQQHPRRRVALKVMRRGHYVDDLHTRMFHREAEILGRLKHPGIAAIYESGHTDDGHDFFAMELVRGLTLGDWLRTRPAVVTQEELELRLRMFETMCEAVSYAHQRGVIHRDVKPANVMLDEKGQAILTDFGIAKIVGGTQHTASGVMLGTARYVSPEQVQGRAVSGQSDIYSLGATLFEMLAGRPPYQGDSVISVLMAHVNEPLPDLNQIRPGLAPGLSALISKAMAKEPGARFRTAGEMAQALRATVSGKPMPGVVDTGAATAYLGGSQPAAPGVSRPAAANTGAATILENVAPSAPPASPPPAGGRPSGGRFSGNSLLAIVGLVAVLLVLCAGAILGYTLLSGDNGDAAATEQAAITLTVEAGPTTVAGAGSPLTPEEGASPTLPPPSPTAATPTVVATPTVAATEPPTSTPTNAPSPTATHTLAPTQPASTATPAPATNGITFMPKMSRDNIMAVANTMTPMNFFNKSNRILSTSVSVLSAMFFSKKSSTIFKKSSTGFARNITRTA